MTKEKKVRPKVMTPLMYEKGERDAKQLASKREQKHFKNLWENSENTEIMKVLKRIEKRIITLQLE